MKFFSAALLLCFTVCSCTTQIRSDYSYKKKTVRKVEFSEKNKQKLPDDFFTMRGGFTVRKLVDTYALHLSPFPIRANKIFFGPEIKKSVSISADVFASKRDGTMPLFGIGAHGFGGLKLLVTQSDFGPTLTLFYGENRVLAKHPISWRTDSWTTLKLEIYFSSENNVEILGKAWTKGTKEPSWMFKAEGSFKFNPGQCSLWARPFSGRDIWFDNLLIQVPEKSALPAEITLKATK